MNDELFLVDDSSNMRVEDMWKVLIVDDEESVHVITNTAIKNKVIDGKKLFILNAMSAAQAKEILDEHDDIALALIDVVMETASAGLDLVDYIRNDMKNKNIRLVLRTGQPSHVPEESIIERYDINDYKEKTELTSKKLHILIRTSIIQYAQYKEIEASRDEIYAKMTTSELTKLPNRIKLNECLDSEGSKSLIIIDIDDFSTINDTRGYEVGDEVLRDFSSFLVRKYHNQMQVFHLQSDVFAMLCYDKTTKDTTACMRNIKADVHEHTFRGGNTDFHLTTSIGMALHEQGGLIKKAEFALKEARHFGKDNVKTYSDDLNVIRTIHANSLWSDRIHQALKNDKIHACFQPIKNLKTDKIDKYETLVRLEFKGEIYSPYLFLDAALYSCQLFNIFKVMYRKACQKAQNNTYSFSINVSQYDLEEEEFVSFVKETVKEYSIEPSRLVFEVLEHNSISENESIHDLLNELHDYGFKISIDDFGANCSNFAQLNNLKIDFIKIDGSFVKNIVDDKNSQIISKTIIDFAHQKGIPVIAEFVCTKEVYNYVKELGADYAQGYEICAPQEELYKEHLKNI